MGLIVAVVGWRQLAQVPPAQLTVNVWPRMDGRVLIDGQARGAPGIALDVAPGQHAVGFAADDYDVAPQTLTLQSSQARTVTLTAVAHPAVLTVDSVPPHAALTVAGRAGRAPFTVSVAPGTVLLRAAADGYQPEQSRVTVTPGERRDVTVTLTRLPDPHRHVSAPPGGWSAPVPLASGQTVVLAARARVRVRTAAGVLLLEGPGPVALGDLPVGDMQFKAAGPQAVDVDVVLHRPGP